MNNWLPSGVSLVVLVTMVTCGVCAAQETCAKLEVTGFRPGDTVRVEHNRYVNVTFHLETSHCPYSPEWFRVKMTRNQSGLQSDICTVMFQNATCQVTDRSESCRCIPGDEASVELYKNFSQTGTTVYTWAWSDSERKQATRKVMITFDVGAADVTPPATGSVSDTASTTSVTTDATNDTQSKKNEAPESPNVSTAVVVSCVVTASVFGIPIAFVIAVYVHRRRRGVASPNTDGGRRPEPEITSNLRPHVHENLEPSETAEGEYSMIPYEFLPQDPSSPAEKYEALVEEKVEDPSLYSRLHYQSSGLQGKGRDKNRKRQGAHSLSRQAVHCRITEMREFLRPSATVSTGELDGANARQSEVAGEYLEPVQTAADMLTEPSGT